LIPFSMKIAFVSLMKILPWGGSEELWYKTAKLALTNGNSVYTLTQRWPDTPSKIEELQQLGAHTQFYYTAAYPPLVDRVAIKLRLKQRINDLVPDIKADVYILSNGSVFDFIYNQQIIKKIIESGKPYIMISQHNFENGNIAPINQRDYAINTIEKAAQFFFVSERNIHSAERQLAYAINNAQVISNPINIQKVSVKKYPLSTKLLMACVARIDCSFKGQDILLQVLSTELWAGRDFQLSLYGSGPHLAYLQQLIEFYSLQDKVVIEGHVHNVDQIWEANQVLVLPSLSEGTPLALVEAMLSGRAALSTDVGDNNKYVLSGTTGFLTPIASPECIATALEELWQHKEELQTMGENAYNHAMRITDLHPDRTLLNFIEGIM
jgi:glycosyltransferase involved in cell wall biosynthesis